MIVYIIQAGETNLLKIGYTSNLERRLRNLQTGNPLRLKVLRAYETSQHRKLERLLLDMTARDKKQGEWVETPVESLLFEIDTKIRETRKELFDEC